jgi:glycosyltransferase involved in cell wall biosynthesis
MGTTTIELRHVLYAYDSVGDADIVHDHTVAGPLLASLRPRHPVVTTCHGPFTEDVRALYRATAGRVPLIAISHHQASTAVDVPIARVIHHGIDTSCFPVGTGTGGYALFLGRMSPAKGVREAILLARQAGMPLVMAVKQRDQHERDYFDSVVRPLLGADVTYLGEVSGAEKLELLGGATALLNPIQWDEPFGLNIIEALACGTPVVATPRGSVPEIINDGVTGLLGSSNEQLVDGLRHAGQLDRRACRAAVEQRFSMQRMTQDHIDFYGDVLAAGRERGRFDLLGPAPTRSWLDRDGARRGTLGRHRPSGSLSS